MGTARCWPARPGWGRATCSNGRSSTWRRTGWAPVRAHGDPTRHQPFDAFGDLLPALVGEPDRWAMLLRAGVGHLVERAGRGRPVLVADDLHAFDLASAALVQVAVTEGRLPLVATLRTGGSAPDAVTALWKHDLVERIDVLPLDAGETARLAEALVGGPIDAATRARLWAWTEGNPLLVTDIVEQARLHDGWHRVAGLWALARRPGPLAPAGRAARRAAGRRPAAGDRPGRRRGPRRPPADAGGRRPRRAGRWWPRPNACGW